MHLVGGLSVVRDTVACMGNTADDIARALSAEALRRFAVQLSPELLGELLRSLSRSLGSCYICTTELTSDDGAMFAGKPLCPSCRTALLSLREGHPVEWSRVLVLVVPE